MQEMNATKAADKLLEGLDYPIGKAAILRSARELSLDDTILKQLETLPERDYSDAEDVSRALNAQP
jgi:hypothetical protein